MQPTWASLPATVGRIAAITFITCGILAPGRRVALPLEAGADILAVTIVELHRHHLRVASSWLLPWNSWPRSVHASLRPAGLRAHRRGSGLPRGFAYAFGALFCVCFTAVGLAHRPGTAVAMLPFFAAAYVVPLAGHRARSFTASRASPLSSGPLSWWWPRPWPGSPPVSIVSQKRPSQGAYRRERHQRRPHVGGRSRALPEAPRPG